MSIEDDVVLLDRVPTFHLLGNAAIRVLAIGSEQQEFASGSVLFRAGDASDCGYVVQRGSFHLGFPGGSKDDIVAGPGALIGELALIVPMTRPATATAREYASVIRITRTLFQRVLDSANFILGEDDQTLEGVVLKELQAQSATLSRLRGRGSTAVTPRTSST